MLVLKALLRTLIIVLAAFAIAIAVSAVSAPYSGEVLVSIHEIRITVSGVGDAAAFLTILLFSWIWMIERKKRGNNTGTRLERLNAAGFGVLPGIAIWKIFEQATALSRGKPVFAPLPETAIFSEMGYFTPSRTELIFSVIIFSGLVLWLILRRKEFDGNGDLFWTVLCIWGQIRAFSVRFRIHSFPIQGTVWVEQIIWLVVSFLPLILWTIRNHNINGFSWLPVVVWIVVLCCGTFLVLSTADVLSTGSSIGDLAVSAGGTGLSILLILLAGKDSRR